MRIINLIENTEGEMGCAVAHGLSFYIETKKHRLLVDLGPSGETLKNAEKLGVDLTKVDTVILSHGHYDHSGGIIPFSSINPEAAIYMQSNAGEDYFSIDGENIKERYIGIDKAILDLPQVKLIHGDLDIDDELSLFTVDVRKYEVPSTNSHLMLKKDGEFQPDSFSHEHCLVIKEGDKRVLLSGCAHNGILNILEEYRRKFGGEPTAAISGFHLMKKGDYTDEELLMIIDIAKELNKYKTVFYTCHCTSIPAFKVMKRIMGERLKYVHSGDEVRLSAEAGSNKVRRSFMKYHKFFAWATVFCFVMTMITGYKRK